MGKMISRKEKARLAAWVLWVKACRHDGIPTDAKFVTLSPDNPFDKPYNKAMENYIRLLYQANSISVI